MLHLIFERFLYLMFLRWFLTVYCIFNFVCSWCMAGDMVHLFNVMFFSLGVDKVVFEMCFTVGFHFFRGIMFSQDCKVAK